MKFDTWKSVFLCTRLTSRRSTTDTSFSCSPTIKKKKKSSRKKHKHIIFLNSRVVASFFLLNLDLCDLYDFISFSHFPEKCIGQMIWLLTQLIDKKAINIG